MEEQNDADVERGVPRLRSTFDLGSEGDSLKRTLDLSVSNLSYKISTRVKGQLEERVLLNSVSARARPGQILAVVGPSGAGKSTFLDAVAGRISPACLQGSIQVNGKPLEASFKLQSGYVMQDDQLFPMLTVRETLLYSARLRLPPSMSMDSKKRRVQMLIDQLGLASCANTIVGNSEVRGVSGGEKRRVSIGVDLIHDPAVLFLDEPTSGLDSTAALNVVQILHDMAEQRRRTIIMTIHQPSFRILELIHNFLVLARGSAVYHGSYSGMISFFKEFGREVPDHVNALEFALDLIEEEDVRDIGLADIVAFQHKHEETAAPSDGGALGNLGDVVGPTRASSSFIAEVIILSDRNLKIIFRTKELFLARIMLMVVMGLILGSIFWKSEYTPQGAQNRASFFAFALALLVFTSTEALPIFLDERQIFIRETSRGAYRTAAYVLSGALVFVPFLFTLACVFSGVSYFMVGLAMNASAFFVFVAAVFLTLAATNSFVIFFAAFVPNFVAGQTIVTATNAFFFLFSGFFIKWSAIPKYWIWFNYLSTFKYPLQMMTLNEFQSLDQVCWGATLPDGTCSLTSQDVLYSLDYQNEQIWWSALVMVGWFLLYRVFLFFALVIQTAKVRK